MDKIASRERKKYYKLWQHYPLYRLYSPGQFCVSCFFNVFSSDIKKGDHVIDFGCGTGRVALAFLEKGLDVTLMDFSPNCLDDNIAQLVSEKLRFIEACLWELPKNMAKAEWIYCCDVLEHIPEEKIDIVLENMSRLNLKGGFFSICLKPDNFGPTSIKSPLHICIKNKNWWKSKIKVHWDIKDELIDAENSFISYCVLKK